VEEPKDRFTAKQGQYLAYLHLYRKLRRYSPSESEITAAGGTFCGTFGPEELPGGVGEFLGYFMPHKVIAGKETMKAAGTVSKKLMKWLVEKGYVEDAEAAQMAEERAGDAARELPAAQDVVDLLESYLDEHAPPRKTAPWNSTPDNQGPSSICSRESNWGRGRGSPCP
jgi:hypothetical protein